MWFSFYFILQMSAKQIVKRSIYNIKDNLYYTNIEKNLINKLTVCYLFSACADMGLCHKKKNILYKIHWEQKIFLSKLFFIPKQTNENKISVKENITYTICISSFKAFLSSFYLAIFVHSCPYKKALVGLYQTHKERRKLKKQKEIPRSNISSLRTLFLKTFTFTQFFG